MLKLIILLTVILIVWLIIMALALMAIYRCSMEMEYEKKGFHR